MLWKDWILVEGITFNSALNALSPTLNNIMDDMLGEFTLSQENVNRHIGWLNLNKQVIQTIEEKIINQSRIFEIGSIDTTYSSTYTDNITNNSTNTTDRDETFTQDGANGSNTIGTTNYQNTSTSDNSNNIISDVLVNDGVVNKDATTTELNSVLDIVKFFDYDAKPYYEGLLMDYQNKFLITIISYGN